MSTPPLLTLKDAAAVFGVRPNTVSQVASKLGIEFKPMINGKAKGLDPSDMRKLRRAFIPARQPA